jgi:membrane associated rhomboid family serine protease
MKIKSAFTSSTLLTIVTIVSIVLVYIFENMPSEKTEWLRPLHHANIFHLCVNCYALWCTLRSPAIPMSLWIALPIAYIASVIGFALSPEYAIGASGIVYAICGIIYAYCRSRKNTCIILFLIAISFVPNIATEVHLYSLFFGFIFGLIHKLLTPNS